MNKAHTEYELCKTQILKLAADLLCDCVRDRAPQEIIDRCEELVMLLEKQNKHVSWKV